MITENFNKFNLYMNNTVTRKNKNNIPCVLWINNHKLDKKINETGVTSNMPTNSVTIYNDIKRH